MIRTRCRLTVEFARDAHRDGRAARARWLASGARWIRPEEQPHPWSTSRQLRQIGARAGMIVTMETDADFARRAGLLVRGHQHGLALLQHQDRTYADPRMRAAIEALLRASCGYSRSVIRTWASSGALDRSAAPDGIEAQPIAAPSVLADATLRLSACEASVLASEPLCELVDCTLAIALAFDSMERGSKQQRIQGHSLLVRHIAPCLVALLPARVPRGGDPVRLEALRAEGRELIDRGVL